MFTFLQHGLVFNITIARVVDNECTWVIIV